MGQRRFFIVFNVFVCSFIFVLFCAETLYAQSATPQTSPFLPQALSIQHDNDVIFNSDSDYSSGLFIRVTNWGQLKHAARGLTRLLFPKDQQHTLQSSLSWFLGQDIYTPMITDRPDFVPYERPFSGWLYTGLEYQVQGPRWGLNLRIRLGYTGRYTFAQDIQQGLHKFIYLFYDGISLSRGWDFQLPHEFTFQSSVTWEVYLLEAFSGGSKYMDLTVRTELALGTVFVYPELRVLWRVGWLDRRPHAAPIWSVHSKAGKASSPSHRGWSLAFFVEPFARLVIRNLFLDGLLFRKSHHIERYPAVGGFEAGLNWRAGHFRLRLGIVIQSLDAPFALRVYKDHKFFRLLVAYELPV